LIPFHIGLYPVPSLTDLAVKPFALQAFIHAGSAVVSFKLISLLTRITGFVLRSTSTFVAVIFTRIACPFVEKLGIRTPRARALGVAALEAV